MASQETNENGILTHRFELSQKTSETSAEKTVLSGKPSLHPRWEFPGPVVVDSRGSYTVCIFRENFTKDMDPQVESAPKPLLKITIPGTDLASNESSMVFSDLASGFSVSIGVTTQESR